MLMHDLTLLAAMTGTTPVAQADQPSQVQPMQRFESLEADSPDMAWYREALRTRDGRMAWWREARFGMFIHWGVYSHLEGMWQGKPVSGYAEHIQRSQKITMAEYRRVAVEPFNPTQFDADEWMRLAHDAGMRYLVITAKHHDGFAMFDSDVSDYNVVDATPWGRDPMKGLKAAGDRQGVRLCFYYSQAWDWGAYQADPNTWRGAQPDLDNPVELAEAQRYVDEKSIPQLRELISKYDPGMIWCDTGGKLPKSENWWIMKHMRAAGPNVIINGRCVYGYGDYRNTTDNPNEFAPVEGDWEGIPTTNGSYGYHRGATKYYEPGYFIQLLAKAVARGGNLLLNVGPMGNGKIAEQDVAILRGIGAWMAVNDASIHGCGRSGLPVQAWGQSTRKGGKVYLHVFDWPKDDRLTVAGLSVDPTRAYLLSDPTQATLVTRRISPRDVLITVPADAPDAINSVIVVEIGADLTPDATFLIQPSVTTNRLHVFDGQLQGKQIAYGRGKASDDYIAKWPNAEESVKWSARTNESATYELLVEYEAESASVGGTYAVQIGAQTIEGTVKPGKKQLESLGQVTLDAGAFDVAVTPRQIVGEHLMFLRSVQLKPVERE